MALFSWTKAVAQQQMVQEERRNPSSNQKRTVKKAQSKRLNTVHLLIR